MSSATNESSERKKISKVSIAPISDNALVVRIRKFSTEVKEENLPQVSEDFKSIVPKPLDPRSLEQHRAAMADSTPKSSKSSKQVKKQRSRSTRSESEGVPDSPPCLKHAAENIGKKAQEIPSEKINLCSNCSKSMLSYIFLVQDFLDSLAKEIVGDSSTKCLQCAREEVRRNVASSGNSAQASSPEKQSQRNQAGSSSVRQGDRGPQGSESHRARRAGDYASHSPVSASQQNPPFVYNVSAPTDYSQASRVHSDGHAHSESAYDSKGPLSQHSNASYDSSDRQTSCNYPSADNQQAATPGHQSHQNQSYVQHSSQYSGSIQDQQHASHIYSTNQSHGVQEVRGSASSYGNQPEYQNQQPHGGYAPHQNMQPPHGHVQDAHSHSTEGGSPVFRSPQERVQPHYETPTSHVGRHHNDQNNNFPPQHSPSLYGEDLDGIISTLSNAEREVYDAARDGAGRENFTESQERFRSSSAPIASEAFVTSCRNNAEALGCLVVGTSLLLCRTSRTLCVLVSDGVSQAFRGALSAVFHLVQNVRNLDSLGTTKLSLLEQPELGITFEKLNVWRLTQFTKCVYLNPDTLVIQNCDELFGREELSAVPDIGWPDCFNSGVFVFAPSVHTFWALMEHADKQGSYDGGDQGLLNSYFNSWSSDINKKLSFVYNLMANVSYTYTPAFKQFGRNVKIVQFHGSFKPWHVKFFSKTGQVSPSSPVHPTYVQFVHIWLNIFRISVLRLMSPEIQAYAASQEIICAVEMLRYFPLPAESEAEFYLTPPSVRLRRALRKLDQPAPLPISEARRRKSAEYSKYVGPEDDEEAADPPAGKSSATGEPAAGSSSATGEPAAGSSPAADDQPEEVVPGDAKDASKPEDDGEAKVGAPSAVEAPKKKVKDPNAIPGSDVGDYEGMMAWEQGRMDYEGSDSSDNVLKRLQYLMKKPSGK